ncbi:hypothetical protein TCAL_15919 [Tigriopus californicus]|uniref:Uncharacterized protein n=2 Tax=Tigriopus californicus TaxID=6832 RepID=A0A553PH16_TIGCA|nr:hypothetical protein TCAL_15919 [Tigriopus californicus]
MMQISPGKGAIKQTANTLEPPFPVDPPVRKLLHLLMGRQDRHLTSLCVACVVLFAVLVQIASPIAGEQVPAEWLDKWMDHNLNLPANGIDEQALTRLFKRAGSAPEMDEQALTRLFKRPSAIRLLRRAPMGGAIRYGKRSPLAVAQFMDETEDMEDQTVGKRGGMIRLLRSSFPALANDESDEMEKRNPIRLVRNTANNRPMVRLLRSNKMLRLLKRSPETD